VILNTRIAAIVERNDVEPRKQFWNAKDVNLHFVRAVDLSSLARLVVDNFALNAQNLPLIFASVRKVSQLVACMPYIVCRAQLIDSCPANCVHLICVLIASHVKELLDVLVVMWFQASRQSSAVS